MPTTLGEVAGETGPCSPHHQHRMDQTGQENQILKPKQIFFFLNDKNENCVWSLINIYVYENHYNIII